jgi:hypothetical protein
VKVATRAGVSAPRSFADYEVTVDRDRLPTGVELLELS